MQQTILIIGGTSGLGRRLAELYCGEGCKVGVIGRRKELLDTLQQSFPSCIIPFQLDIGKEDCNAKINNIIAALGGIDKFILSASVVEFNPSMDWEIESSTININISGYA